MKNTQTRTLAIFAALAALMAATRFNHFGSAVALPDASLAVFFLGGLYLSRCSARASVAAFAALIMGAGMIDYYATAMQGVSDWCMTPAYWFLAPVYGSLWLAGRWVALRRTAQGRGLLVLGAAAWAATSLAFVLSNAAFYLFSGYFAGMGAAEYASRVSEYYVSYVAMALMYIAVAVAIHAAIRIAANRQAATSA
ncbi:MAG TPA: hypothetical protein VGD24_00760 [Gallionella sp.]